MEQQLHITNDQLNKLRDLYRQGEKDRDANLSTPLGICAFINDMIIHDFEGGFRIGNAPPIAEARATDQGYELVPRSGADAGRILVFLWSKPWCSRRSSEPGRNA